MDGVECRDESKCLPARASGTRVRIMWPMTFQLPPGLPHEVAQQLQWSCLAGGPDNMPWPTDLSMQTGVLTLTRQTEESGHLVAPWPVDGAGQLMGTSATLMTRQHPY